MSIDRNAKDAGRLRRNMQRLRAGDGTSDVKLSSPLKFSGGAIGVTLAASGGIQNASGLAVKLDSAGALSVGASGIAAQVDGTSVQIVTNKLAVKLNAAGAITGTSGLAVAVDGASVQITSNALAVKVAAAGALTIGSGVGVNVDGSTVQIATNALAVKLNAAGAITGASGLATAVDASTIEISSNALRVKDAGIVTAKLADNAVTTIKITDANVTTAKIADLNVTTVKLAANAVTPAKLALATSGGLADNGSGFLQVNGAKSLSSDPTPSDGDQWYNTTEKKFKSQSAGGIGRRSQVVFAATSSSTAIKNTTTLTAVSGFVWQPPANYLTVGKTVRVKLGGAYTATGSSPLLTIDLFSNGTFGGIDGVAINLGTNPSGRFHTEFVATIRTTGVSGTVTPTGFLAIEAAGVNAFQTFGQGSGVAIDTTSAGNWNPVVQWSAASNSNSVTFHYMTVEVLE